MPDLPPPPDPGAPPPPPPPPPEERPPPSGDAGVDETAADAALVGGGAVGAAAEVDASAVEGAPGEHGKERADRFRTIVAIAIALVSILGAIVAFTGTLASQTASQLDQSGIEDTSNQQRIITDLSATVQEDVRNLAPYQEDLKAASILQSQAATLQSSDP